MDNKYLDTKKQLEDLNGALEDFKREMNLYSIDVEYNVYAYDHNYYEVDVTTDYGHALTLSGEFMMVFGCIESLSETEFNR